MKYLLDTHTVLWCVGNSKRLSSQTKEIIANRNKDVFISSVSLWETTIKVNLGKLELNSTFGEFLDKVRSGDFVILQIEDEHLKRLATLPSIHGDPFDRMLIAQSLAEDFVLVGCDEVFDRYGVRRLW